MSKLDDKDTLGTNPPRSAGAEMSRVLNLFSAQCGLTADQKGFHQAFADAQFLERLAFAGGSDRMGQFSPEERTRLEDIAKRIRLLEVGMKMMLIVSELAEGLESLRDTGFDGHLNGEGNLGEELADAGIRLADLSSLIGTQLGNDIVDKMSVNDGRPYRHGRHA